MKRCFMALLLAGVALASLAQTNPDRTTLVKNSIPLSKWHEETFWSTYDGYRINVQKALPEHTLTLKILANFDSIGDAVAAFDYARRILKQRNDEIDLLQQYFQKISTSNNGTIALLFLQVETLVTMMEEAVVYETAPWHQIVFSSQLANKIHDTDRYPVTFSKAFSLTPVESTAFRETYIKYENEKENLLGKKYDDYSLYTGDPAELTSAFSKRLGNDFIEVMKREVKLKEKYLDEMNRSVGPARAAQFLAWEEYNAIIYKMSVWTEDDVEAEGILAATR